jgi:hypothetical protein
MDNKLPFTPRPWSSLKERVLDSDFIQICECNSESESEFIVESCNNYEKLQRINKELLREFEQLLQYTIEKNDDSWHHRASSPFRYEYIQDLENLLKKAKEV